MTSKEVAGRVRAVLHLLRCFPEQAQYLLQMPQRTRVQPEELWMAPLGFWLRLSDCSISADRARGRAYPGIIQRWMIRRAVETWKQAGNA